MNEAQSDCRTEPTAEGSVGHPPRTPRGTVDPPSLDVCIHELVERRVAQQPDAVAVVDGPRRLTYGELDRRADRLAGRLLERGLEVEERVGVCAERSPELLVAAYAVLKAGGAYVPIDPTVPRSRIDSILQDASARVILADPRFADLLSGASGEIVPLVSEDGGDAALDRRREGGSPRRLAYVVHTSGSTGTPKGVMVEHRSVVNLIRFYLDVHRLSPADRTTLLMRPGFDASVVEIWPPLAAGATIVVPDERDYMDPCRLLGWMARESITFSDVPTPLAETIFAQTPPRGLVLRSLITGGDKLRTRPPADFPCAVYDQYGPTENAVVTTQGLVAPENGSDEPLDIGRPIANHRVHVLDDSLAPVAPGEVGELVLAGVGVARGYLDRPEETERRFVTDPFSDEPGARMFRSGDLGRERPDGRIEFIGRADHQVKIRGFRIELGEVEHALVRQPGVREAIVELRDLPTGGRQLVAWWITACESDPPDVRALRDGLRERLPHYMVPSRFVRLERWPVTANGKVDRRALPDPAPAPAPGSDDAPRNELEAQMVAVWQDVLGCPVGIHDDFFEIGGESLLAARIFSRLERLHALDLPLALLFEAPTIAAIADHVRGVAPIRLDRSVVRLQEEGRRPPLFFLPGIGGHVLSFRELARRLGPEQPSYGLQDPAFAGLARAFDRIPDMAAYYLEQIHRLVGDRPIRLCGYSFGGKVALEMAQQLWRAGAPADFVALLDTPAPGYPRRLPLPQRIGIHVANVARLSPRARRSYVAERWGNLLARFRPRSVQVELAARGAERMADALTPRMGHVVASHYRADAAYGLSPYPGAITLFRAGEHPDWPATSFQDECMGWSGLVQGGVEVFEVPGSHLGMLEGENLERLAELLRGALETGSGGASAAVELADASPARAV